ncbi:hypothetical protein FPOAC2_00498 [Fusarium poae]|jgi:hypothetical protein
MTAHGHVRHMDIEEANHWATRNFSLYMIFNTLSLLIHFSTWSEKFGSFPFIILLNFTIFVWPPSLRTISQSQPHSQPRISIAYYDYQVNLSGSYWSSVPVLAIVIVLAQSSGAIPAALTLLYLCIAMASTFQSPLSQSQYTPLQMEWQLSYQKGKARSPCALVPPTIVVPVRRFGSA